MDKIILKDHSEFNWINLKDLESFDLCPADRMIVKEIMKRNLKL